MINEFVGNNINQWGVMTIVREALIDNRYVIAAEEFDITILPELHFKGGK